MTCEGLSKYLWPYLHPSQESLNICQINFFYDILVIKKTRLLVFLLILLNSRVWIPNSTSVNCLLLKDFFAIRQLDAKNARILTGRRSERRKGWVRVQHLRQSSDTHVPRAPQISRCIPVQKSRWLHLQIFERVWGRHKKFNQLLVKIFRWISLKMCSSVHIFGYLNS